MDSFIYCFNVRGEKGQKQLCEIKNVSKLKSNKIKVCQFKNRHLIARQEGTIQKHFFPQNSCLLQYVHMQTTVY